MPENKENKILELGTGSGIIAVTLMIIREKWYSTAIDISDKALVVAKNNALNHKVQNRIKFIKSNWLNELPQQKFDCVISNPPYIDLNDTDISDAAKTYEPHTALFSNDNGLESYNKILASIKSYCHKNSIIIFEHGWQQSQDIQNIALKNDFKVISTHKDLANKDRAIVLGL